MLRLPPADRYQGAGQYAFMPRVLQSSGMNLIDRVINKFGPEDREQYDVVQHLETLQLYYPTLRFTSIPNATWTKSIEQRTRNTLLGLRPGLSDLLVLYPEHWLLFVEMKRARVKGQTRGVLSPEQQAWITALNTLAAVEAVKCEGYDEFKVLIDGLLPLPSSAAVVAGDVF